MVPPNMLPSPNMFGPSSRPSMVGGGSGGAGGPHSVRHMGQEVFLSSHCWMQPLQKTCLLRARLRVRARACSVACQCTAQAASPLQQGWAYSSEQLSCRSRSPSLKPDMQMAHCVGCAMFGSDSDAAGLGLANRSSSASTRWAFSMQPASGTPCASISRLRSPTGKLASTSAPALAPGAPRQQKKTRGCTPIPDAAEPQKGVQKGVPRRGPAREGWRGTAGGVECGGWHRVAVPRSGRAARPRRLRWRDRANSRPMRGRPPPIGCRKESPRLPGDHGGWWEFGKWGGVGGGGS